MGWEPLYWENKAAVVEMVKAQGLRHWTILKPALIMENLVPPMVDVMYPSLAERGRFETAIAPDTRLDWIAAHDIGAFAAAAFADPARFHGHEIDLAAESLTLPEIAAKVTEATEAGLCHHFVGRRDARKTPWCDDLPARVMEQC